MRPSSSPDTEHDEIRDPAATDARPPVDDGPYFQRYDESTSGGRRALWLIIAALAIAALGGGYYYWLQRQKVAPPMQTQPPRAETAPTPQPEAEAAIRHPIEAARPETGAEAAAEPTALPSLDESDRSVADALAGIVDRGALDEFLNLTGLVRRVVVTVDNLPRKKTAQRLWPLKPTAGRFLATGDGQAVYLSPDNARRYEPFVRLVESVDTGKLAALYVRFYPLFQQAYRELGYPKGYFNDRLVEVIDHLLVTPEIDGPIRLAKPWIMYEFADPALEARSAGQKTLIRMGAANAQRVKTKLREFRRQIAGRTVTQ